MARKITRSIHDFVLPEVLCHEKDLSKQQRDILQEAVRQFDEAIMATPTDEDAWYGKALSLYKLGLTGKAEECLKQADKLSQTKGTGSGRKQVDSVKKAPGF